MDPHVVSLEYALELDDTLRFDNPTPLEGDAGSFTYTLADGVLTLVMKDHYATTEEAKNAVWPFLCAWELDYALTRGRREFRFRFVRPHVVDLSGGGFVLQPDAVVYTLTGHDAVLITTLRTYPAPPVDFEAFPDVETLWNRYQNQLLGREYLPSMGYFFLTVIETLYGAPSSPTTRPRKPSAKRVKTAKALNVELRVLNKLGELTTERGDPMTARKVGAGPLRPLTPREQAWIQAALREIMRRVGMKKAGAVIPLLTMDDLPSA